MNSLRSMAMIFLCAGLAVFATSCQPSGPRLFPATGKVLVNNAPAEGATVVLVPTNDANPWKPSGLVAADGSFDLKTYPLGRGAPAGEYSVLITWYPAEARSAENPVNRLPARYADPGLTPLPKVTLKDGTNTLEPFLVSAK
jgi:hypothetical protein